MNRKKRMKIVFAFVIVLIIVVGVALYFKYGPSGNDGVPVGKDYCSQDSDCLKVQTGCCPCSSGGQEVCTNKVGEEEIRGSLGGCDSKGMICAQVYNCKITSCLCMDGKCTENQ